MGTRVSRVALGVISFVLIASILLSVVGIMTVRRSFPVVSGKLKVARLQGPVDIYRDGFGTPHIYATTQHDLYFAQGFVHAQDRFWQMDFWRHLGSGRLSEMFGESQLETDKFLRTMGWRRVSEQELNALDDESLKILEVLCGGGECIPGGSSRGCVESGICNIKIAQRRLSARIMAAAPFADLGKGHGLGPGRQHG